VTLLATVSELADHLRTEIDPDDASALQALEGATSACIEYVPEHSFFPVDDEEVTFRGDGTDLLVLKKPLVSVTSVTLDGTELTAETDYYVSAAGNLKRPFARVWTLGKIIEVVYSYGDQEIPASARLACLQEAAERYKPTSNSDSAPVGSSDYTSEAVTIDDYSHSYTRGGATLATRALTSASRTLLEPFRVQSVV
jgi:hypothetical protein